MLNRCRYETITDLMTLQDQIETFQKLVFSHFRSGANNECRIASLVPLVQESYGIYKFITSMLRAMHTSKCSSRRATRSLISPKQRATKRHWSHYAVDMMLSIIDWSSSTTNARISDI